MQGYERIGRCMFPSFALSFVLADFPFLFDVSTLAAVIAVAAIIVVIVILIFLWKVIRALGLNRDDVMDITYTAGDIAQKAHDGPEEIAYRAGRGFLRALGEERSQMPGQYQQPYGSPPPQHYHPPSYAYPPPVPPPPPSPPEIPTFDGTVDDTIQEPPSYRYDPEGSAYHQPRSGPKRPPDRERY